MGLQIVLELCLIVVFAAFFIYMIIKDRCEKKKQNLVKNLLSEQITENSNTNKEILKFLKFSAEKYVDEINETQVRIIVDSVFSNSQLEILCYASKILRDNHIKGNEREISAKLKSFINNRFHKDSLTLKEFKFKEKNLADVLKKDWKNYITENVVEIILNNKEEKALVSMLQNAYDSFKYDILDKTI